MSSPALFFENASAQSSGGSSAQISVSVSTPPPQLSLSSPALGQLDVHWSWDFVSPGYFPPPITEVLVEISNDGLNYGVITPPVSFPSHSVFMASFPGLAYGNYWAQVTILDGNDIDYVVGPLVLSPPPPPGGPGRSNSSTNQTDLIINGLSYPGPSNVVIFTYNSGFQASIVPTNSGDFQYATTALPSGSGILSFSAQDQDNVLSLPVTIPYTLLANTPSIINDINLPPTISMDQPVIVLGGTVQVKGYGYRSGSVSLSVDGPTSRTYLVQASFSGAWQVFLDTTDIGPGTYDLTAQSSSQDGSINSPESDVLVLQVTTGIPAAPVCGNGVVEASEQCDDGNLISGDGCSASCASEAGLPQSSIDQPAPSTFTADPVQLTYSASSPSGAITDVHVWYSRNGAPYVEFPTAFTTSPVALNGLADGDYEAYSIAHDSAGLDELAPVVPDATFIVDKVVELNIIAYPEKRFPPQGNWAMPATLTLYQPGTKNLLQTYTVTTDNQGRIGIPALALPQQSYNFLLKGKSQLSKRLDSLAFRGVDLLLDYSFGSTFFLLSGDVHADDYINGLDLSATVIHLYNAFADADLNRDGIVNGMDLSIIVTNLFKSGDGA